MSHTVQNNTIRVTVTPEIWSAYTARAEREAHRQVLPSGDVVEHKPDEIRRGLILSEAMSKLGNASELELIDSEVAEAEAYAQGQMFLRHVERRYREAQADTTGWQIEIIGQMPAQIGMCTYVERA